MDRIAKALLAVQGVLLLAGFILGVADGCIAAVAGSSFCGGMFVCMALSELDEEYAKGDRK
jgi:hypothetical protein